MVDDGAGDSAVWYVDADGDTFGSASLTASSCEQPDGYVANVAQSGPALEGIRLSATLFSSVPFALGVGCLLLYPITRELNLQISAELERRRQTFAA